MTPSLAEYMGSLQRDCAEMAQVAAGNLEARVPGCPDWNVRKLLQHTGLVLHFWTEIADNRLQDPEDVQRARAPDEEVMLLTWFNEVSNHSAQVLGAADPAIRVWTWAPRKDIGFIQRRMPQELAVHSWDARSAVSDSPRRIDPDMAADGVDEFFDTFVLGYRGEEGPVGPAKSGTLHLHQTDGDGEWFVRYGPDGVTSSKEHAKGDAAVRGTASDLLLMLWRRVPTDSPSLEIHGDDTKLDEFVSWMDLT
ncbi:MAG: maleylpyruvate isomerase family mycothiol-dependent enzyme [Actinobacteria bacterium]|nr:maleylpyruvate isomerase family mycothiol-dependent enzyme [Actinomycetota bacterium]